MALLICTVLYLASCGTLLYAALRERKDRLDQYQQLDLLRRASVSIIMLHGRYGRIEAPAVTAKYLRLRWGISNNRAFIEAVNPDRRHSDVDATTLDLETVQGR